ncbi:MAG: hypothetical protein IAC55_00325 [Tyzzerella sp.]|uniref:Uncharacterized protein n=1 Tax=Candidatus Fimicola merdigallinarum TaxID=2840819 RepID=A0A9D9DX30_9FIRM|nr:hypothetical protein [Candidatus Fimicola merdigallinarum]
MRLRLLCVVIGFFIGSINLDFIFGKIMKVGCANNDSGSLLSKNERIIKFVSFFIKAVLSFFICRNIFGDTIGSSAGIYGYIGTMLGRDFSVVLKRGEKY